MYVSLTRAANSSVGSGVISEVAGVEVRLEERDACSNMCECIYWIGSIFESVCISLLSSIRSD